MVKIGLRSKTKTRFAIVPVGDLTDKLLNSSTSLNLTDVRKSLDGSTCLLEVCGPVPEWLLIYKILPYELALQLVRTVEWEEAPEQEEGQAAAKA